MAQEKRNLYMMFIAFMLFPLQVVCVGTSLWDMYQNSSILTEIHKKYSHSGKARVDWTAEFPEQCLIHAFLRPGDAILEFGGNSGRSTAVAAEMAGITGKVWSVESSSEFRAYAYKMYKPLVDEGRIVQLPAISDVPIYQNSWFTTTNATHALAEGWKEIERVTYKQLKDRIGHYNVVIADCEGCFYELQHQHPDVLHSVDTIILEADGEQNQGPNSFAAFRKRLENHFSHVEIEGLQGLFYSVWRRRHHK